MSLAYGILQQCVNVIVNTVICSSFSLKQLLAKAVHFTVLGAPVYA